jgi:hypothetical protein
MIVRRISGESAIFAALFLFLLPNPILLAQFTFQQFSVPGSSSTSFTNINNSGTIAGVYSTDSAGGPAGYLRSADGTINTFSLTSVCPPRPDLPPGSNNCAGVNVDVTSLNDVGQIAGHTFNPNQMFIGTPGGSFTLIPPPPGFLAIEVFGLNNAGESLVKLFVAGMPNSQFALRSPEGTYMPLSPPPGFFVILNANLNNEGLIAGTAVAADRPGQVGFVVNPVSNQYTIVDLAAGGLPGIPAGSTIFAINDQGTVLGVHTDSFETGSFVPFTGNYSGSGIHSFVVPGESNGFSLFGINNAGQINGSSTATDTGFVGTPTSTSVPPAISVTGVSPGPPSQAFFSVSDPASGVFSVATECVNCSFAIAPFTPGQKTPVTVTATKIDASATSTVAIEAIDSFGNVADFDPDFVTVGVGKGNAVTLPALPAEERVAVISNGKPGLNRLTITVNGHRVALALPQRDSRILNLSPWMVSGSNEVTFEGEGPVGAQASVLLTDAARHRTLVK